MMNKKAFTLIELLVVVLIIGILAAVALPQYQKAVTKSRLAEVAIRVKSLEQAIDLYVLENGYPASGTVDLFDVYPDLTGGLAEKNCSADFSCYGSKHALYYVLCEQNSCHLHAFYSKSGNPATVPPSSDIIWAFRYKYKSSGWETGSCYYGSNENQALCGLFPNYGASTD